MKHLCPLLKFNHKEPKIAVSEAGGTIFPMPIIFGIYPLKLPPEKLGNSNARALEHPTGCRKFNTPKLQVSLTYDLSKEVDLRESLTPNIG